MSLAKDSFGESPKTNLAAEGYLTTSYISPKGEQERGQFFRRINWK